jgi:hypothetical protein
MAPTAVEVSFSDVLHQMPDQDYKGRPLRKPAILVQKPTIGHLDDAAGGDAGGDTQPAPAAPSGGGDFDTFKALVVNAMGGAPAAKAAGVAPAPTQVVLVPKGEDPAVIELHNIAVNMASMVQLYTTIYDFDQQKKRGVKQPNGISDASQAKQAFADQADAAFLALTGPLSGFCNIDSETVDTFHKNMHKSEIHLEFLGNVFKGFNLGKDALTQLDGVLTNFVSSISDLNITSTSESNTVDHTCVIHQVAHTNMTGDDSDPQFIFEPKIKLVYLKIDSESWAWATNKASDSGFDFTMHNTIVNATINVEKWKGHQDKFDKIFEYLTGKNLEAYGTEVTGTPVKTED